MWPQCVWQTGAFNVHSVARGNIECSFSAVARCVNEVQTEQSRAQSLAIATVEGVKNRFLDTFLRGPKCFWLYLIVHVRNRLRYPQQRE